MLFDFSEPERNTARRALEIHVSDLREEIVKTAADTSGCKRYTRKKRSPSA